MSPPIRDGSGSSIGAIRLGDGSEIAEVRTGAGDVLFSAIPDSQIHHYNPDNFTTSNWPDDVGTSDIATISGLSFDSSAFGSSGGVVAEAANSDHGLSDTMEDFGSNRDSDFAISVPFNTSDDGKMLLGHDESGAAARTIELGIGVSFHGASSGELGFRLRDSNGNTLTAATNGNTFNNGNDNHLILNKTSNSAGGLEFYVDDMTTNLGSNDTDTGFGNATVQDLDGAMGYFCRSQSGSPSFEISATMGNVRWFDNSLSQSERESVNSALPY